MKNVFIILLLFVAGLTYAQNSSDYDATFKSNSTYLISDITGATSDTIGSGDSTWTYTSRLYPPSKLFYDMYIALDSIGGTAATVTVALNGRDMSVDSWTEITAVTWDNGADTTINFEQFTTAQPYKDYQVTVTGSTDSFTVRVTRFIQRYLLD